MTAKSLTKQQNQEDPIIPAKSGGVILHCVHTFLAVMAAAALRLLFVFRFPSTAGDSDTYLELAHNWADHHIYGLWIGGHLVPTDLRMPGYPAFLSGIAMLIGRSMTAISLSQALLDLATCFLTAAMAAALAPASARRRVWIAALWLAATCPFIANYSAVVLTEVLVTFFTAAALACFVQSLRQPPADFKLWGHPGGPTPVAYALLGAFVTGLATLVRPEMPLLLAIAGFVLAVRFWKFMSFRRMVITGAAMVGLFLVPLAPWAARNFVTLREVQLIAPRYATMPGEYAPVGYYAWTRTWLERYRDVFYSVWAIGEDPMNIADSPPVAFDSPDEKTRVAALFNQYNHDPDMEISPELDREFAKLAVERTARHPLRTYVEVPFQRALTIWFTPRTELLPIDGKIWPLREQWQDSHADVLTTAGFAVLGYLYVALAVAGIGFAWRVGQSTGKLNLQGQPNYWGIVLLVAYIFARTLFLTTVEAPEPRYVVSCYPAIQALIALLFAGKRLSKQK